MMNQKYEILFTPTKIGSVEIKNRFVMCAMESTGIINWLQGMGFNAKLRDLFLERAQDGVGLLIPGTIPLYSVPMHKWLYQNPKAFKGLSQLMEEIHGYGSKMFIQLTADSVIVSIGYAAGNPFVEKEQKHVHILGDADHVANLKAAIWAANDLAIQLSK